MTVNKLFSSRFLFHFNVHTYDWNQGIKQKLKKVKSIKNENNTLEYI